MAHLTLCPHVQAISLEGMFRSKCHRISFFVHAVFHRYRLKLHHCLPNDIKKQAYYSIITWNINASMCIILCLFFYFFFHLLWDFTGYIFLTFYLFCPYKSFLDANNNSIHIHWFNVINYSFDHLLTILKIFSTGIKSGCLR